MTTAVCSVENNWRVRDNPEDILTKLIFVLKMNKSRKEKDGEDLSVQ